MGSTRLYVIHPVSLWNGTSSSPSATAVGFSASQGHTSPSEIPPSVVRVLGQMGARPSMSADHSENIWTFRVDPSGFDSDSRKSDKDRNCKLSGVYIPHATRAHRQCCLVWR